MSTAEPRPSTAAVFLDKDGTLIEDVPYNADPSLLRFMPGAIEGLRTFAAAGLPVLIVTNQPGIAIGRITRGAFAALQAALERRVRDEAGVDLAGWYFCPHSPAWKPGCECRKPSPGMFRRAAVERGIDLARSWMVGDILDDIEAGHRAGCRAVLLDVGNETEWRMSPLREPDRRCSDLLEAAQWIVAQHRRGEPLHADATRVAA